MGCDFCNSDDRRPSALILKEYGGAEVRIVLCRNCTIRIAKLMNRKVKLSNPPKGD